MDTRTQIEILIGVLSSVTSGSIAFYVRSAAKTFEKLAAVVEDHGRLLGEHNTKIALLELRITSVEKRAA